MAAIARGEDIVEDLTYCLQSGGSLVAILTGGSGGASGAGGDIGVVGLFGGSHYKSRERI